MPAIRAPVLSDGRFSLRGLTPRDIPAIVTACRDPEIPRWTNVPSPYLREDAERFLALVATDSAAGNGIALAVCAGEDDALIGTVGLMGVHDGRAEIGYWIAAPARGRGAATAAVRLMCAWARAELGLLELEILAHPDNRPSQRVAEAAGFGATGRTRIPARLPVDRRSALLVYAWPSARRPRL